MQDDAFEWDDAKATANWRTHRITFEMARDAFKDPFAIEWIGDRPDTQEQRFAMLAAVGARLLFVAYALRGDRIRIISARKAEPNERRRYHDENREA
jgi:uncharacterized protein